MSGQQTKLQQLAQSIKNLISSHYAITGSSSKKGHVQAGSTPQSIGTSLSAGTDNGYYARADHVHTVSYDKISGTPNLNNYSQTNHTHDNRYYTETEVDNLLQQERNKILLISPNVLQKSDNISIKTVPIENNCIQVDKKIKFYNKINLNFKDNFGRTSQEHTIEDGKLSFIAKSNGGMTAPLRTQYSNDYAIEFKCKGPSVFNGIRFGIQSVNATAIEEYFMAVDYEINEIILDFHGGSRTEHLYYYTANVTSQHTVKFEIIGNSIKYYFDGALVYTRNISGTTWVHDELQLTVHSWGATDTPLIIEDFIIYEL